MKTQKVSERELIKKDSELAEELVQKSDAQELYVLYQKRVKELDTLGEALDGLITHFAGENKQPRFRQEPSETSIAAMEKVALAAIELCKTIAENKTA